MGKPPAFQFYTGDWLKDPSLGMCSPATRGVWIDLMCVMHERNRSGLITGTREQIARICRCTVVELDAAINELQTTSAADITQRDSVVTITCRRMKREAEERKSAAERKRRQRSRDAPEDVTKKSRSYSSTSTSSSNNHPPPPISAASPDGRKVVVDSLKDLGVIKLECVNEALEAGCKVAHIQGLIQHYESHWREIGWTVNALVHRIEKARPGMAIAEGWPPGNAPKVEKPVEVEDWQPVPEMPCPECGKTHRGNRRRKQIFACVPCLQNYELRGST